ncbi:MULTISPECIES: multidrug efflux SMR transporter [unclassified Paenibacillus]|uniref:DMT family transporter n=1 Tax=unclassified Paenibacillus TaxID=185978 RepID=UPI00095433A9|nr:MULTISPECIES: multidrug efflux SMR transporter [unclassified Paenibacillus]ASS68019.1 multidrug efflux SMR transporter [Paenibacillus sp. RUD330]SIR41352.1 paired small multidrug resistance pump [Paenibacillus sp. RU4X]SIR51516.1 paired small multidrug resistance pump [Paenibacillus sp. RU4T]
MAWAYLIGAGLCEIFGVAMMNRLTRRRDFVSLLLLAAGFALSFSLLSLAMRTIPMGTAYAIWTGIGASGGALVGMLFYGESKNPLRILFIVLVLGAAVGLKAAG